MRIDSLFQDIRYAVRTFRRAPLFAATVAATIGLGLGLLGSAFTLLNAYLLKPIDLPDPHALYALSWDTDTTRRQQLRLSDYEALGFVRQPLRTREIHARPAQHRGAGVGAPEMDRTPPRLVHNQVADPTSVETAPVYPSRYPRRRHPSDAV
jgi:hypothetical protein